MGQRKKDERSRNTNPIKHRGRSRVLRKDKQLLFHMWHQSCYPCYKPDDKGIYQRSFVTQRFCCGCNYDFNCTYSLRIVFLILDKPTVWLRCVQINYTTYIGDSLSVSSNQQSVFRYWHDSLSVSSNQQSVFRYWHGLLDIFNIEI
jgi:hypothetical protein